MIIAEILTIDVLSFLEYPKILAGTKVPYRLAGEPRSRSTPRQSNLSQPNTETEKIPWSRYLDVEAVYRFEIALLHTMVKL